MQTPQPPQSCTLQESDGNFLLGKVTQTRWLSKGKGGGGCMHQWCRSQASSAQ